jgi:sulfatase-like protein
MTPGCRAPLVVLARLANALFFVVVSTYCLLTFSPFAYQQFIRPHMVAALTNLIVWHPALYWATLAATAATLWPYLSTARVRWVAGPYLATAAGIGVWLTLTSVLPEGDNTGRGLALAIGASAMPLWLAAVDHAAVRIRYDPQPSSERRIVLASTLAAMLVWATYAAIAPVRFRHSVGIVLSPRGFALGTAIALVSILAAFSVLALTLVAIVRAAARTPAPAAIEYWSCCALTAWLVAAVVRSVVFAPIAFTGAAAWTMAVLVGALIALLWSSVARYRLAESRTPVRSGIDAWLAAVSLGDSRIAPALGLCALPVAAFFAVERAAALDWNFMLQKLSAIAASGAAFALVYSVLAPARRAARPSTAWIAPLGAVAVYVVAAATVARLPRLLDRPELTPEFVLDNYSAANPALRVVREAVAADPNEGADFYRYLRASSTIQRADVQPARVDFVQPLEPAPGRPPHIFFFIIDSLRPDYLSPYNPTVHFTPAFDAFARDSVVFERAFTRYGGTGLSVPSIWAGAMVLHKEYVTPFAPTDALEKLLVANRYERWITKDHITDDLFSPADWRTTLDRAVPEMQHTFCGTMQELERDLAGRAAGGPPLFAMTRPLDLHVANLRDGEVPAGERYPGFYAPAAARVHRIDACFGRFVDVLTRTGLYDDSIIVVMSDHGDSLGDLLRWGHAYTLFPEVLHIPLMIHVPRALRQRMPMDCDRFGFSIDVTPTLYALLGYEPKRKGPLFGESLAAATDTYPRYLIASSYGAVYGVLSDRGRRLYIADAIERREYAYELGDLIREPLGRRVGVRDDERRANRQFIRDQVAALGARYGFEPSAP